MRAKQLLVIVFFLVCCVSHIDATIYYVANPGIGYGNNCGDSWANAAPDIQHILTPSNYPTLLNPNEPITITGVDGNYQVRFYDLAGRLVKLDNVTSESCVNAPSLSGFYQLEIRQNNKQTFTEKIIVR
ncbi:MAG: T9SS type A sorting domain-containing protein [Bacteroidales bacterium]|nr:T9SS type A sorting domain-containing protein [Bacteroidales bacterium]